MPQTYRTNLWLLGEGRGTGIVREFGMDIYTLIYLKWITNRTYFITYGTLLSVPWQPGWDRCLGENGYIYMYSLVPLLFTWNYHNIVNWLYPNTKWEVKRKNWTVPIQPYGNYNQGLHKGNQNFHGKWLNEIPWKQILNLKDIGEYAVMWTVLCQRFLQSSLNQIIYNISLYIKIQGK